jgi:hypothetical protein
MEWDQERNNYNFTWLYQSQYCDYGSENCALNTFDNRKTETTEIDYKIILFWGCMRTEWRREYLDLRERKWQEAGEECIMRSFITCTLHQILLGWSDQGRWHATEHTAHIKEMRNAYKTLVGKLKEKRLLERPRHRCEVILQCILKKQTGEMWTGWIWLRIEISVGILWTR